MSTDDQPWSKPDADVLGDIRRIHDANPPTFNAGGDRWAAYCALGRFWHTALTLLTRPPAEHIVTIKESPVLTGTVIVLVNMDQLPPPLPPFELNIDAEIARMREHRENVAMFRWLKVWP